VLTDSSGDQLHFYDFSGSWPANQRGQLKSFVDPYGITNTTSVRYDATSGKVTTIQQSFQSVIQTYTFTYVSSGTNAGLLQNVSVDHGSDPAFRQVVYTYYDGTTSGGNAGDLRTAQIQQIKDGVTTTVDTYYYRYYVSGDPNGFAHALKYGFGPDSYARLTNLYPDLTTASDDQASVFADVYFRFDSQGRVSRQDVQGAGASSATGSGKFTFAYTPSANPAGTNSWQVNTTVTLPDNSNQQIVYTNSYGEPMLDVFVSGSNKWENLTKYDLTGRVMLTANPSALTGYDDSKADLLNSQNGNYYYMSDNAGLVRVFDYFSSGGAGETTAGGVIGYQQDVKIQQGELGGGILLNSWQYFLHTASGVSVAPVASMKAYRDTLGSVFELTTYGYYWFPGTTQAQWTKVFLPSIGSGQNGPGTAILSGCTSTPWGGRPGTWTLAASLPSPIMIRRPAPSPGAFRTSMSTTPVTS
jgi:hypothetical protein